MKVVLRAKAAFTLVEVSIALGIVAFCLVPLIGMLPIGIKNDQAAIEQTSANAILSAVAADLRAVSVTIPYGQGTPTQQYQIPIPANPVTDAAVASPTTLYFNGDGKFSATATADARYLLTVQFAKNGTAARAATLASLQVSWPATVPAAQASGTARMFVALNRN